MTLSILVITKAEPFAWPFLRAAKALAQDAGADLVVAADGAAAEAALLLTDDLANHTYRVKSKGYLESVHDQALGFTTGDYVLRLDDDEQCSPAMRRWILAKDYEAEPHWKFGRAHLWGSPTTFLMTPQLFPDHQTRLSKRELAGGRDHLHAGSPHGGGAVAPVLIEHHKFLVKSQAERAAIADRYEKIHPGYGRGGMLAFNLPEAAYTDFPVASLGEGLLFEPREIR